MGSVDKRLYPRAPQRVPCVDHTLLYDDDMA